MVYTILISIVFIAEIIITISILQCLISIDKKIVKFDNSLSSIQSSIKSICNLSKKISDQLKFLAEDFVLNIKKESEDFLLKQLSKTLVGIFVLRLNIKAVKNFQKSKIGKLLGKGLSLLEIMV